MSTLAEATATTEELSAVSRKDRRIAHTQEIYIRSVHRRRKVLTRGGVLVGFVLAMVVYPVVGTISPYASAADALPGVVEGAAPTTALALLGGGPELKSADLPLPTVDDDTVELAAESFVVETALPACDATTKVKGSNGRLTSGSLCSLWVRGEALQPEAAIALAAMNNNFRSVFGRNICLDDSYRSLSQQYGTRAARGYLAASPGTSMHGWGLAVDICKEDLRGATGKWIRANADTFGWFNPPWAKTRKFEPWHWEYERLVAKYYDFTGGSGNYSDGGASSNSTKKSSGSSGSSTKGSTDGKGSTGTGTGTGTETENPEPADPAPEPSAAG